MEHTTINDSITDTIIVTSSAVNVIDPGLVEQLQRWITAAILTMFQVGNDNPLQIVLLKSMKRVLIISPNKQISEEIMNASSKNLNFKEINFNYSLKDSGSQIKKEYLKLPVNDHLFLVSPPSSPPPEFDYSQCEANPDSKLYHQDVAIQLKNGHGDNETFTVLKNNTGHITVSTCQSIAEPDSHLNIIPTSLPPKSIFDSDEDSDT